MFSRFFILFFGVSSFFSLLHIRDSISVQQVRCMYPEQQHILQYDNMNANLVFISTPIGGWRQGTCYIMYQYHTVHEIHGIVRYNSSNNCACCHAQSASARRQQTINGTTTAATTLHVGMHKTNERGDSRDHQWYDNRSSNNCCGHVVMHKTHERVDSLDH